MVKHINISGEKLTVMHVENRGKSYTLLIQYGEVSVLPITATKTIFREDESQIEEQIKHIEIS